MDAWQLGTWECYRDVARLGRKTRLPEAQRLVLWSIFEKEIADLERHGLKTPSAVFTALAANLAEKKSPYDYAVVDECQDLSVSQLRFFAALGGERPNALFFAGDFVQRIFQQPYSWKSLGVDIRGRSRSIRINYRTSHQIRQQADRLLGPEITDVDGNRQDRSDTISVFNGPAPRTVDYADEELEALGRHLMRDLAANADKKTINTKDGDKIEYDEFRVGSSKPIIDPTDHFPLLMPTKQIIPDRTGFRKTDRERRRSSSVLACPGSSRGPSSARCRVRGIHRAAG